MNLRVFGLEISMGAVLLAAAAGQELAGQPPAAPWLAAEPAVGVWTLSLTTEDPGESTTADRAAGGAPPRTIVTTVQSGTRCEVADFGSGISSACWEVDGVWLVPEPTRTGNILVFERADEPSGLGNYSPRALGFAAFAWMRGRDYVGLVEFQGVRCHHFRSADGVREAWISADTRRPAAIRLGGLLGRYTYRAVPTAPLVLPEEFLGALLRHRAFTARLRRLDRDLAR